MENPSKLANAQTRILVVDDHPTTASTLARAISQSWPSVEVISATSGKIALDRVKNGAVDLVITDMMMPDMNGLELLEKLQTHPGGRPVYTILITAYDVPGLKETARRLKVNETIIKPIRPERICQTVGRVLEEINHAKSPSRSTEAQATFKVLIADDIPDNVSLLSRYLQSEGYAFVTASDGVETLEKVCSEMPDLILLDVNMPKKDGFQVLKEIRADPVLEHIPVIILTAARPDSSDMQYGLNLGADDYVIKPFDRRELLARIHTKLRAKESEEIIRRRYKELSVLPEIGKELSARLDINDLTDVVLRRSVEILGAMLGYIIIFNPRGRLQKSYSVSTSLTSTAQIPDLDMLIQQIKETRQGLIIADVQNDSRWKGAAGEPMRSAILAPLFGRLDLIGLLVLTHEQTGYFKSDHLILSQAIASQAAIAVENSRLHESVMLEQQRLAAILQSTEDAVLMFDADGRLELVNPAGEKLFEDHPIMLGQPLERGNGCDALVRNLEQALASKGPVDADIEWSDHRSFTAQFTPIEVNSCVVILHDVTRFKDWKRVTDEFISTASHNLKHPITVITGFAQLLPQVGPLNEKQMGYANQINIAAQNMNVLVQDMLDLVKADLGTGAEIKRESVDLHEVISEIIFEFRPQAFAKRQTLQFDSVERHFTIQAEPTQIRQVLRNLVNNAIKYTPDGGSVTITLETLDHKVVTKVQDTGYGIPPEDLPLIFNRFYRVKNNDTRGIEGNGLGLAIVRSIVEQHGGQVTVVSECGKGSCFSIILPLSQSSVSQKALEESKVEVLSDNGDKNL